MTDSPNTKEKSYCIYNLSSPWNTCEFEYDIAFLTNNVNVTVSGIGAVVTVVDYQLCGWVQLPARAAVFSRAYHCA